MKSAKCAREAHPEQGGLTNLRLNGYGGHHDRANRGVGSQLNPYYSFGAGHCNKYTSLENTPVLVRFQKPTSTNLLTLDGRDLWSNVANPYQFDQTFVRRLENKSKEIVEMQIDEKLRSRSLLSARTSSTWSGPESSGRSSSRSARHQFIGGISIPNARVTRMARDKPGYQGFISGEYSENVHGRVFKENTRECHELRPYLRKLGAKTWHALDRGAPLPAKLG